MIKPDLASAFHFLSSSVANPVSQGQSPDTFLADLITFCSKSCRLPLEVPTKEIAEKYLTEFSDDVKRVLKSERPPLPLAFYYFGLYEVQDKPTGTITTRMYVSGGNGQPAETGPYADDLIWIPQKGDIKCSALEEIKAQNVPRECRTFLSYALPLGVAIFLVRFGFDPGTNSAIFVGFDNGDCLKIK